MLAENRGRKRPPETVAFIFFCKIFFCKFFVAEQVEIEMREELACEIALRNRQMSDAFFMWRELCRPFVLGESGLCRVDEYERQVDSSRSLTHCVLRSGGDDVNSLIWNFCGRKRSCGVDVCVARSCAERARMQREV
jgi:hypothetical protein